MAEKKAKQDKEAESQKKRTEMFEAWKKQKADEEAQYEKKQIEILEAWKKERADEEAQYDKKQIEMVEARKKWVKDTDQINDGKTGLSALFNQIDRKEWIYALVKQQYLPRALQ